MRIDAHHHLRDLAVRDQPWTRDVPALRGTFTADEIRPALARNAVDVTVVVQTVAETLTGHLSAAEREAVFGTTAARWYGIAA
ncbi:hypothetical protein ACIBBB_33210 [Streptomyces sp. NPDC051217]|uniref:hypothetical protein n=1 Tax=Streptomyces sp. NPDC051217 TaxID=3365644 RepID=UPI0037AC0663